MNVDDVISHYIGRVVRDRKNIQNASVCSEGVTRSVYERELERDQIVLAGLRCAKANGFSGEDLV